MCSSPKPRKKASQKTSKQQNSLLSTMNRQSMEKFTAIANAAEDRRDVIRKKKQMEKAQIIATQVQVKAERTAELKEQSILNYWLFHADIVELVQNFPSDKSNHQV